MQDYFLILLLPPTRPGSSKTTKKNNTKAWLTDIILCPLRWIFLKTVSYDVSNSCWLEKIKKETDQFVLSFHLYVILYAPHVY